ncbi:MAG: hypothetical protein NT146_07720 [Mycobacterium sp.]|nr:hypothetical protein [Mycobacterium sp.]
MVVMVDAASNAAPADRPTRDWPVPRAVLRWEFLATITVIAFHESLRSLIAGTRAGSLIGYVWFMLLAMLVAGVAVAWRQHTELPIHDRQTDVIVGSLGMLITLMVQGILLQRYSQYFLLLRIDLVAMWFFVISSSTLLFGLRPLARFASVFALPVLMTPLAYQVLVIFFGGSRVAAGAGTVLIAAAASAIALGRNRIHALTGALAAWCVGLVFLFLMEFTAPDAPLLAFQMIPATLALLVVNSGGFFLHARRGIPIRTLNRKVRPLATKQIGSVIPVVLAVGAALSFINMPTQAAPTPLEKEMIFGRTLAAPAGWQMTSETNYSWVRRIHGRDATLIRHQFVADVGDPRWDKFARPRTVVVDATSTWRPISLQVFPSTILYDKSSSRISEPKFIDLGHGITGALRTAVDEKLLVSFDLLSFTWRNNGSAQRVQIASVDNHDEDALFPEPNGGMVPEIRQMFSVLFRGNAVTVNTEPTFKDAEMLTVFGRGLVDAQLARAEQSP